MLHAFAIVAPPEQVPGLLAQRCAGVVNRVSFLVCAPPPELRSALHPDALHPDALHPDAIS
jgi:hypothetical protein